MSKVRYGHVLYERVRTEFDELLGMRNEMIVSTFIYVSFGWTICTQGPNYVPVL